MAGLTDTGFEIKRLTDLITDLRSNASSLFADLVPDGDAVDTGDYTAIGRMIGIILDPLTDVWEAAQQVYDSFNAETATGYSLDNIVALAGVSRNPDTATSAYVVLTGDNGAVVTTSGQVQSSTTKYTFSFQQSTVLESTTSCGIGISINTVEDAASYYLKWADDGITFTTLTITSSSSSTAESILEQLYDAINTSYSSLFTVSYDDNGYLFIDSTDPFITYDFDYSTNITVEKCRNLALVTCDTVGPFAQVAYSIDTIYVPILSWDSVYNPLAATTGSYKETDEELRVRWNDSKFLQAQNSVEAISSALSSVDDVSYVMVYENVSDTEDEFGVPAHSFMPVVYGGLSSQIADAIWENKPIGIKSHGDTTVTITDSQGLTHDISYKVPTDVNIYVELTVEDTGDIPGDVESQIQVAITSWAEALTIGDDVIYSRLYTPINTVSGFQVNSLYIGTTASPTGVSNISIDFDERAAFTTDNITVTVA